MGGGITGSKGNPDSNISLEDKSTEFFDSVKPLYAQANKGVANILGQGPDQFNDLTGANAETLKTGAANAYIPSIQRATEASNRAVSQASARTSEDLTRQGITGTDYNTIMANALQQGYFQSGQAAEPYLTKQADAQTGYLYGQATGNQNFYRDILSSFYKALTGVPQIGLQGLGTAAGNETNINAVNTKAATDLIVGLAQAAGTGASGTNFT